MVASEVSFLHCITAPEPWEKAPGLFCLDSMHAGNVQIDSSWKSQRFRKAQPGLRRSIRGSHAPLDVAQRP